MPKIGTVLGVMFLLVTLGRGVGTFVYDIWLRPPLDIPPPQPLPLAAPRGDEDQAREAVIERLVQTPGVDRAALDPELLERAYYLAGEAQVMYWNPHNVELFPPWPGYRYVVGRADGAWTRYWSGCRRGNQAYGSDGTVWAGWSDADTADVAVHPYPGLADAGRVGVAVAWRSDRAYVAVLWAHDEPCPDVERTDVPFTSQAERLPQRSPPRRHTRYLPLVGWNQKEAPPPWRIAPSGRRCTTAPGQSEEAKEGNP